MFREIAGGQRTIDVELPEKATIKDLIHKLSKLFGEEIENVTVNRKTGSQKFQNIILLNGRNIQFLQNLQTRLNKGDTVSFFPPVGGG